MQSEDTNTEWVIDSFTTTLLIQLLLWDVALYNSAPWRSCCILSNCKLVNRNQGQNQVLQTETYSENDDCVMWIAWCRWTMNILVQVQDAALNAKYEERGRYSSQNTENCSISHVVQVCHCMPWTPPAELALSMAKEENTMERWRYSFARAAFAAIQLAAEQWVHRISECHSTGRPTWFVAPKWTWPIWPVTSLPCEPSHCSHRQPADGRKT